MCRILLLVKGRSWRFTVSSDGWVQWELVDKWPCYSWKQDPVRRCWQLTVNSVWLKPHTVVYHAALNIHSLHFQPWVNEYISFPLSVIYIITFVICIRFKQIKGLKRGEGFFFFKVLTTKVKLWFRLKKTANILCHTWGQLLQYLSLDACKQN